MSNTATLVYHATAAGPVVPTTLEAVMAAVDLDFAAIEAVTGCTFVSDVTGLTGSTANRTIVFGLNNADYLANFPAGTDQSCPFVELYTQALSAAIKTKVIADPVVIA